MKQSNYNPPAERLLTDVRGRGNKCPGVFEQVVWVYFGSQYAQSLPQMGTVIRLCAHNFSHPPLHCVDVPITHISALHATSLLVISSFTPMPCGWTESLACWTAHTAQQTDPGGLRGPAEAAFAAANRVRFVRDLYMLDGSGWSVSVDGEACFKQTIQRSSLCSQMHVSNKAC